ncbi:hypothetical protein ACKRZS_003449 [Fusarium odoratissimum]|uniref:C2H2-type domain-containing protein n=3 Tax=Fusarium oxysporum species complex TaxID=171631 RepID=N1SBK0_FUSC4|nr:uncharacterized protein FOIG_04687 [Fusarium odoratissimum NRRL 54006]EMT73630.1 hypothetical protein FOC4_g10002119 [Fusarium odoratissimum]EXM04471.1 hypothetical protein FOIG_04687 [Fusarium odoratissimum NRRL 54006]KAK2126565.1 hypothetical protein NOF04DRAFT_18430 [Fusarium oxysporum II5]TXB99301.1 hypothetical protein FocTR4_00012410 [Fusarium oxysporum f. sp. cubense]
MSIITLLPSGLQIHQEFGVGLVLHESNYYSIAPKQRKLPTNLQILIQQLCILSLFADSCKPEGRNQNKNQEVATKVQDEASPLPSEGQISAATRHYNNGANGDPNAVVQFPGNRRHRHWWFLHCLTLESYGSEPPSFGYKRVGSPGSGNQSGEKKQRSNRENNDRNDGKGNKGNGQGPGKKKRGFGPQQPFIKKLACLFFKLDPQKYQCCAGYNLIKWDHVLQHLKRIHLIQGEHCPNCRKEFEGEFAEAEKNAHILQDACEKKTLLETGLLLEEEYNDLTGLHGSHEEKWYKAWKKLFGEHPAPYSPFIETLESMLEVQYSTLERELPSLLQSFLRNAMVRPDGDSTSATTNAILRLIRNPLPTSSSIVHGEPQAGLAPSTLGQLPEVHDIPPSHDPEPSPNPGESFRPNTDDIYAQPDVSTMETRPFASQDIPDELLWPQPSEESSIFDPVFFGEDEYFDQWINCLGGGQYFEGLGNSGPTLE